MAKPLFMPISPACAVSQRWALMRNTEEENIQEHSHMVAVLAHALALIRTRVFGLPADANAVAVAALYHDASGNHRPATCRRPSNIITPEIRDAYQQGRGCGERTSCSAMLPDELQARTMSAMHQDCEDDDDAKARQSGGQALGLHQVRRRAQGGQYGVQKAPRSRRARALE